MIFKFFFRHDCHLCEEMYHLILAYQKNHPIEIIMLNIDKDPLLQEKYALLIPVLTDENDNEICHYFFDKIAFEQQLNAKSL